MARLIGTATLLLTADSGAAAGPAGLASTMREHGLDPVSIPMRGTVAGRGTGAGLAEPLWRHIVGDYLRLLRIRSGRTLLETARRAGVSAQYLSEMERGVKDPSSEMIAAVAGALDVTLLDLTVAVARELHSHQVHAADRASRRAQGFALAA